MNKSYLSIYPPHFCNAHQPLDCTAKEQTEGYADDEEANERPAPRAQHVAKILEQLLHHALVCGGVSHCCVCAESN